MEGGGGGLIGLKRIKFAFLKKTTFYNFIQKLNAQISGHGCFV